MYTESTNGSNQFLYIWISDSLSYHSTKMWNQASVFIGIYKIINRKHFGFCKLLEIRCQPAEVMVSFVYLSFSFLPRVNTVKHSMATYLCAFVIEDYTRYVYEQKFLKTFVYSKLIKNKTVKLHSYNMLTTFVNISFRCWHWLNWQMEFIHTWYFKGDSIF